MGTGTGDGVVLSRHEQAPRVEREQSELVLS